MRFKLIFILVLVFSQPVYSDTSAVLKYSGHPGYPPVMWLENGKLLGVGPELIKYIFSELGVPVEYVPVYSWKRVQEKMKSGDIDLVAGIYLNSERAVYLDYTIPYMVDPTCIFIKEELPVFRIEDLTGKRGIAMYGESFGEKVDVLIENDLDVTRVFSAKALLENLKNGRADYVIWGYYPWRMSFPDVKGIRILGKPLTEEGMYLAFSKKSSFKGMVPDVNKIILRLKKDGTVDRLLEKYMKVYSEGKK